MENDITTAVTNNLFTVNNLWMMIATALVFIMHLGFATLEAGLTRSKNTVNILFKNSIIPGIGLLTYALVGFNLMYPGAEYTGGFFGFAGFGIGTDADGLTSAYNIGYTYWTDFLFQGMFAATAATIVSGAVAERIKLPTFLVFSTLFVAISYPITGMWKWGGGFLNEMGFYDFAGSTLVHSVGGWGALTGIIFLGARKGKYLKNRIQPLPGHSMPLATIGVFLLWLGWFGFNGGSVLSADPGLVSLVLVTTSLAAAAGGVVPAVDRRAVRRAHRACDRALHRARRRTAARDRDRKAAAAASRRADAAAGCRASRRRSRPAWCAPQAAATAAARPAPPAPPARRSRHRARKPASRRARNARRRRWRRRCRWPRPGPSASARRRTAPRRRRSRRPRRRSRAR